MGKKTLFHPVSLNVIRGALNFCGVTTGRLTQKWYDSVTNEAGYTVVIDKLPTDMRGLDSYALQRKLDSCFATDIRVVGVTMRSSATLARTVVLAHLIAQCPLDQALDYSPLDGRENPYTAAGGESEPLE